MCFLPLNSPAELKELLAFSKMFLLADQITYSVYVIVCLYLSNILGQFQPQPGKPDVWELDSDQDFNVGRNGQSSIDENGGLCMFNWIFKLLQCYMPYLFTWVNFTQSFIRCWLTTEF